ncbi:hypothetical protein E1B28_002746 [Marasmius oreades]|uniref:Uncharacterized protein n=1 Tax=Marasmius oreades TaxID=181124 RepID=A0A9P7UM97_9AGAR|nr:uncharacterized protein E1B28_002746 [Marasmius oreades]KAG7086825.1 hypothetical protein E1B28_002746 [Marasmius oreades]
MVTTRSQARKRAAMGHQQSTEEPTMSSSVTTTPRRSGRKRVSGKTPKAQTKGKAFSTVKSPASVKGKGKKKAAGGKSMPRHQVVVMISTPARYSNRGLPTTPRAPRKSDGGPAFRSSFPDSPIAATDPSTSLDARVEGSDMDMMDSTNDRFTTPSPQTPPHVRFDTRNLVLIPPRHDSSTGVAATTSSGDANANATPFSTRSTPRFLSPRDIAASIPGNWVRSPGQCSQRLVVVPEDQSLRAQYERELQRQLRYNEIFQVQYDALIGDREDCHMVYREFLRSRGELVDDAMVI